MDSLIEKVEYKGFTIETHYDQDPLSPLDDEDQEGIKIWVHPRSRHRIGNVEAPEFPMEPGDVTLPLYLYDHSGIAISTTPFSCPWDSGQVGWVYLPKKQVERFFEDDNENRARKMIVSFIAHYNKYLQGEVYGYVVEDSDGFHLDSCWGIYDDDEGPEVQGKRFVDFHVAQLEMVRRATEVQCRESVEDGISIAKRAEV